MTIYKNQIGVLARIRERVDFAGEDLIIVEVIEPSDPRGKILVKHPNAFDAWAEGAAEEWDIAVAAATKAAAERWAARKAREDGERYGFEVGTHGGFGFGSGSTTIVRSTKTMLFDVRGQRWNRSRRKLIGSYGRGTYLTEDSADELEAFLDGRERVDIVAERKAAAEAADS